MNDGLISKKDSPAIQWNGETLSLLDQRILPNEEVWLEIDSVRDTSDAIHDMVVRGAPAIGITAAYGLVLAAKARFAENPEYWKNDIGADLAYLANARPTAINLFWAINQMRKVMIEIPPGADPVPQLSAIADQIHRDDIAANKTMGKLGAAYIEHNSGVLTHCNAGALATGGYGTALGVIRAGWTENKITSVYADETRPWLQGARLTAWELTQDSIDTSLLADGAAAWLMKQGNIQWVIVGSDRIAANGDVANKIGTYSTAIAARHHGVKFMVVAPTSTIDPETTSGDQIPIEARQPDELFFCGDKQIAAEKAQGWNPVFDVTPAELVDVLVTEKGAIEQTNAEKISALLAS